MPVTYTNRRQQTYHLNALPTKTGGVKYSFAMTPAGRPVKAVPEAYWIPIDRPEPLAQVIRRYLPHLGKESFFDLY